MTPAVRGGGGAGMTPCSVCGDPALYRVGERAFCKRHRNTAKSASAANRDRLDITVSATIDAGFTVDDRMRRQGQQRHLRLGKGAW